MGGHDAEDMPRRSNHHDMLTNSSLHSCAETLQPLDLGVDVVGLDVEVHGALFGWYFLQEDVRPSGSADAPLESRVSGVLVRHQCTAEGIAPELRIAVERRGVAVDDDRRKPASVHSIRIPLAVPRNQRSGAELRAIILEAVRGGPSRRAP